ncbi:MAG: tRNA (guanosine(18)-2'-O)-methyltransferase [Cyclobacteriaceae bacterium]|nr:MAG: tRNA (guanosine(18)-2'-O)-methyltransferase [Cyclobacteriaceae bacterium]
MKSDQSLIEHLGTFISDSKKKGIEQVLSKRTRFITVVLEDIYQSHNASAVIRSCDGFGIQDLHVIESSNEYTLNPNVAQGAYKWVDLIRYNESTGSNVKRCLDYLEGEGYVIYATSPHATDFEIDNLNLEHKAAFLFGTELSGLSEMAKSRAHHQVRIPMYGFTESYNLSVSVALCLQKVIGKLHKSTLNWQLDDEERASIRLNWYRKSVKNAEILEKVFLERGMG